MRHEKRCSFGWVVATKRSSVSGCTLRAPYDTELGLCRLCRSKTLSSRVRFICTPAKEAARGHRCTNNGDWTSGGSLHAAHFTCAQRRHALGRVVDLLPTIQANLISLLLQRERPRLTPMAAAKDDVVKKTKQALNPCRHKISPLVEPRVVMPKRTVKMHSARKCRVCRRENTAFVPADHPKVTDLLIA
jgi:hypothetical protein